MKGADEHVLYLDFDGVLHHENCRWHPGRGPSLSAPDRYELFQHNGLLEQMLDPYPQVKVVLSTTWVVRYGLTKTANLLPPSLQGRVIGATFHSRHMTVDDYLHLPRGQQVHDDVLRRRPRDWLALDDDEEGWPAERTEKFVKTHMYEGLSASSVQDEFRQKLRELCR
jgi:hypothetical protein